MKIITNFKKFESEILCLDVGEPKRNDYVICSNKYWSMDQNNFFLSRIGQIINVNYSNGKPLYRVEYDEDYTEMPTRKIVYGENTMTFWRNEIIHWSERKKDLEPFADLHSDIFKYNL